MTDIVPLSCPDCESENVDVVNEEGHQPGDQAELECDDCGHIEVVTKVPLSAVFSVE